MSAEYVITTARPEDLARLPEIELAAAKLLAGHAPESVLTETTSQDVLKRAQREGRLWVVLADGDAVGFAHVEMIERDAAHLQELDVHPSYGRRGLGTRLVMHVYRWAAAAGLESVTLTTFRDVRWNMRFYARLGFDVVPDTALSSALRAVVEDEQRRGLDPSRRVVMRRPCREPCPSSSRDSAIRAGKQWDAEGNADGERGFEHASDEPKASRGMN